MDIFVPPSLSSADATLKIADALQKLLDPKERQKIEADVKAHHALNDAEAKKAEDARALIKQHQSVLDETKRISEKNKKEVEDLAQKQIAFNQDFEAERIKISEEWSNVKTAAETAKNLHSKAESMISDVAKREDDLRKEKKSHEIESLKVLDKAKEAESTLKKAEEIKKQHTELLESIRSKQAAIAAFNI